MSAPTVIQSSNPAGYLQASPPLFWLRADGMLCLVNETTPLPISSELTLDPTNLATGANQTNGNQKAVILPTRGTDTDRSGTIAVGGTAQQVMASNATRVHLFFQNVSDTVQWICWTGTATAGAGSVKLAAGASYENPSHFCPTGAVSLFCATTGKEFTSTEN